MEDQVTLYNTSLEDSQMFTETPDCVKDSSDMILSRLLNLAASIDKYYTPILCLFGALGNCLSILVFFFKSHNKARGSLSSSVYLSALAISDTGYLINLFILWLQNMGIDLLTNTFMCPTVMYLGQVTGFLSVWLIVAFTIERFFAVCYPLSRSSRCTASRARKITFGLTIFAVMAFSYVCVIAQVLEISEYDSPGIENNTLITSEEEMTRTSNTSLSELSVDFGPAGRTSINSGIQPGSFYSQDNNFSDINQLPKFHTNKTQGELKGDPVVCSKRSSTHGSKESSVKNPATVVYLCTVPEQYMLVSKVSNYIDSILTFIIPFLLIFTLNMNIIFCVKKFKGHRDTMLASVKIFQRNETSSRFSSNQKPKLKDFLTSNMKLKEKKPLKQRPLDGSGNSKVLAVSIERASSYRGIKSPGSCKKCKEVQSNHQRLNSHNHPDDDNPDQNIIQKKIQTEVNIKSVNACLHMPSHITESDSECSSGQITPPFKGALNNHSTAVTEIRVTKTLLLVSSVFLLLHFPAHSIRVASFIQSFGGSLETQRKLYVAQHWANILFNTNFAVNFLLYCCSGKAFRHSVKSLLSWDKGRQPSPGKNTTTTITTQLSLNHSDVLVKKYANTRGNCRSQNGMNSTWKRTQIEDQV